MIKVMHFADAHIDIASHGRHDAVSGLPLRVLDFLKSLDHIVDTAISEKVDLVIFAGDAYKDRLPSPTYQREWGKRIMRLSAAKIPTILLTGNHDVSPASGRAHTLQEFDTLEVPFVRVINKPEFLKPADLWGLPVQVIGLPWIFRTGIVAALDLPLKENENIDDRFNNRISAVVDEWLNQADKKLPSILIGHGTIQGAMFGSERSVMLGNDFKIPPLVVKDNRLDYVALGHLHSFQNLNPFHHPPVIYSGSIERIDFGEAKEKKYFVIAKIEKGNTTFERRRLIGRLFIPMRVKISKDDNMMEKILGRLPGEEMLKGSLVRLVIEYPRDMEPFLDETAIREKCESAFEFHLVRLPKEEARTRFSIDESVANLNPLELLKRYWGMTKQDPGNTQPLQALAASIIQEVSGMAEVDLQSGEK
ncbi:MAG: exonuclease SbcCD subunit D [Anaerolineae bacterium]|nr:exonuclease SbcCD subunit D [Anaerolineae bacterium]